MGNLVNKATGEREYIDDADMPAALSSGKYQAPDVVAVHRLGEDVYSTPDLQKAEATYATPTTGAAVQTSQGHAARERESSGVIGSGKALVGGAVSGLSFGVLNPFEDAQEFHSTLSTVGQIGGALLPGLVGDEAGIAGALARDPVALEHVGGSLSSKFLYAGEVGADASGLERGLVKAGKQLENAKLAAQAPELAGLDAAGLRAARETELDQLAGAHATQRVGTRSAAVDDALAYQAAVKDANPYLVTGEGPASAPFVKASKTLRNAMDDVEGLRESPGSLLKPLRQQAQALEKTLAERETIAGKLEKVNGRIAADLGEDLATLPDAATHVELAGKAARRYAAYADVKLGKGATVQVAREDAQGFLEALQNGEVTGASQQALGKLDGVLQANRELQAKIKAAAAPAIARSELTSARLTSIDAARDVLATPGRKALGEDLLSGTIMGHVAGAFSGLPVIGPMIGAKAGKLATDLVFGRMGKAVAAAGERTKGAVDAFLTVAGRAKPTLAVLGSRALADVAFGPSSSAKAGKGASLVDAFRARTAEIKAQTAYGPDGSPEMRPETRAAMAARLAPIRAAAPIVADRIETLAARRLAFLSSIIPRRPDIAGVPIGPDTWQPSDMQMRSFARSVAAAEDPHAVEERLATGMITPEDAEAYHAVYPERADALKQQILSALPALQNNLPYTRRLSLSIFTGLAVDPSLDPRVLEVLQGNFAGEDGSEGGTQAPTPQPAFGSVRADLGTASQQREGSMR